MSETAGAATRPVFIDSHCHVAGPEYDRDRDEVLARARAAGVAAMVVVASDGTLEANRRVLEVCSRERDCWAIVGVHPHDARLLDDALFERIRALAEDPRVAGIGETGLDFHYDRSPRRAQAEALRRFATLARERGLPLVVHSRASADETLRILREERAHSGVFHCFTYGPAEARRALDLGFYVSFSGIVTFRKAEEVRAAARFVPLDRLLAETDCPFLSPEPRRGGRNEPERVRDVVAGLARAVGRSLEEVATATSANARRLFSLPEMDP
jgi:TatD DNase family protein